MKILSLDTSSSAGSIAILDDRRLVSEWSVGDAGKHSSWLLRSIMAHLEAALCPAAEIDLFAAGVGPGSFTGLRIGIATLKGLAWPLGRKAVGVSTLAALAMNLPYSGKAVCPVLDARKGELYTAIYDTSEGLPRPLLPDAAMRPEALCALVRERGLEGNIIFLGSGLSVYAGLLASSVAGAALAPSPLWQVRASNVGLLAFESAGRAMAPAELAPVYLRKSEAEIKASQQG